jgi:hypothetical protein
MKLASAGCWIDVSGKLDAPRFSRQFDCGGSRGQARVSPHFLGAFAVWVAVDSHYFSLDVLLALLSLRW